MPKYVDHRPPGIARSAGGRHAARRAVRSGPARGAQRSGDGRRTRADEADRRSQLRRVAGRHTRLYAGGGRRADGAAVARMGRPDGARGTDQGAAACLRSPARIARRHAPRSASSTRGRSLRSGFGIREGNAEALDLRSWPDGRRFGHPDGRRIIFMSDRTGVLNLRRACRRRHRDRRPAVDERDPAVADVDHARRDARLWLRQRAEPDGRSDPGSPDEPWRQPHAGRAGRSEPVPRHLRRDSHRTVATSRTSRMSRAATRFTCDHSRRWTASLADLDGADARRVGARRSRSSLLPDESNTLTRVLASHPGRRSARAVRRRCSTPSTSSQIPPATTTCRLTAGGS